MQADQIIETQDGSHSILSHRYGVSYHSKYGAITESRHVFIEAGLYPLIFRKKQINILEIGFGTGLNALLTLIEAQNKNLQIYYEGVEAYPLSAEQYKQLNYPDLLHVAQLKEQFLQLHTTDWENVHQIDAHFGLKKTLQRFEELDYPPKFDLIYFDAFAPSAQPELWEEALLEKMYKALRPEGVMVTYCAKGAVKRRMKAIGFKVESLPGPPGKREMTRGVV